MNTEFWGGVQAGALWCDLHTHSVFSDGTETPQALILAAKQLGLGAVALCDHNVIDGLPSFLQAGARCGIRAVPGVELSTEFAQKELHILALFVPKGAYGAIRERLAAFHLRKEESNRRLIAALARDGYKIDYDALKAERPGCINRAVIGAQLCRQGYCGSVSEAFSRFLSAQAGYYQPPRRPDALDTVRFVQKIGAVSVLAHPLLSAPQSLLREFLPAARACGLDAMETEYALFDKAERAYAAALAAQYRLLQSGGSDFHGANRQQVALGRGKGDLHVPMAMYEELNARHLQKAKEAEQ